jgi:hypothetical protein
LCGRACLRISNFQRPPDVIRTRQDRAFHDGANLYATAKTLGFDIDYKGLLKEFQGRGTLLRAFYYTAVIEDQEYSSIRSADRLAPLQRLHRRHQGDQGIR